MAILQSGRAGARTIRSMVSQPLARILGRSAWFQDLVALNLEPLSRSKHRGQADTFAAPWYTRPCWIVRIVWFVQIVQI
ncbi:hypothetical protein ABTD18_19900, partial [Acinetobacter baumannii]